MSSLQDIWQPSHFFHHFFHSICNTDPQSKSIRSCTPKPGFCELRTQTHSYSKYRNNTRHEVWLGCLYTKLIAFREYFITMEEKSRGVQLKLLMKSIYLSKRICSLNNIFISSFISTNYKNSALVVLYATYLCTFIITQNTLIVDRKYLDNYIKYMY